ncbi:MAG: hypothetical protein FWD72_04440, partial [Eggerthellaceae bacterium]|nr:hypothetical protein [Eggerthellaceae bacterium]
MDDITQHPIKSIADAERYFKAMGCSGFHIARENYDRRDEYEALNISREIELKWRGEAIEASFQRHISTDNAGRSFTYLTDLIFGQG